MPSIPKACSMAFLIAPLTAVSAAACSFPGTVDFIGTAVSLDLESGTSKRLTFSEVGIGAGCDLTNSLVTRDRRIIFERYPQVGIYGPAWEILGTVPAGELAGYDFASDGEWLFVSRYHESRIDAVRISDGMLVPVYSNATARFHSSMVAREGLLALRIGQYNGTGYKLEVLVFRMSPVPAEIFRMSASDLHAEYLNIVGIDESIVSLWINGKMVEIDLTTKNVSLVTRVPSSAYPLVRWESEVVYADSGRLVLLNLSDNSERVLVEGFRGDKLDFSDEIVVWAYYDTVHPLFNIHSPIGIGFIAILVLVVLNLLIFGWRRYARLRRRAHHEPGPENESLGNALKSDQPASAKRP